MSKYLDVVAAYDGQADTLVERYEAVSSGRMLAEVLPVIPNGSDNKLALDVGAGTGLDAAWLTSFGYEIVAAEPATGMRRVTATSSSRKLPDPLRGSGVAATPLI